MKMPIDLHAITPQQQAALFDAARRHAHALRSAAIADAFAALWRLVSPARVPSAARPPSARDPVLRPC